MVKSEDVKAKANKAILGINGKVLRLIELARRPHPLIKREYKETHTIFEEVSDYLDILDGIITELLEGN